MSTGTPEYARSGILVFFHCGSNTGYAIGRHEFTFSQVARRLAGSWDRVHFAYPSLDRGPSRGLPQGLTNFLRFDSASSDPTHMDEVGEYVRRNQIRVAFGFDQPVRRPGYRTLRRSGVQYIFSYWGAPMSSVNKGLKLALKRMIYRMSRNGPDHFIFQSEGMQRTATEGVGIPRGRTSVVRSGVDVDHFRPRPDSVWYAHDTLGIPRDRKIVFYSGHMEHRKGVHVIVQSATHLVEEVGRRDLHFVFLGNQPGQERKFDSLYKSTKAEEYILFAGYRDDIAEIQASSYAAVIATTGWDSHTMTAVEVAASGVPLIVSDLPGIREAVSEHTGRRFSPGDHVELGKRIMELADNPDLRDSLGKAARERVLQGYTREHQIQGLERLILRVTGEETWGANRGSPPR